MFPFPFFQAPAQEAPLGQQGEAHAGQEQRGNGPATHRFFCHECSRTSDHAATANRDEEAQQIPQCPHCGSEFLEQMEQEPPQPQLRHPRQLPPLAAGFAGMLQQLQAQLHQQMQASGYQPDPSHGEGLQQQPQPQVPPLEAIFRSLVQMQGGGLRMDGVQFPGLFQAPGHGSFQDILHHLFQQSEHKGPPPTDKDVIASLPRREIKAEEVRADFDCAVCQEAFEPGSQVIQLPCSHDYHDACILPWIENRNTCPTCRYEMKPQEESPSSPRASSASASAPASNTDTNTSTSHLGRHGGASMQDGVYVPQPGGDSDAEMLDEAYTHMYQ